MSILNDMLNTSQMGEPERLDYAIAEKEKLAAKVDALIALLQSKGLITADEAARLTPAPTTLSE